MKNHIVDRRSQSVGAGSPSIVRIGILVFMVAAWTPPGIAAGFSAVQPMQQIRDTSTATLLPSGKVLVAGGGAGPAGTPLPSAEVYDPDSGNWVLTGSLATGRYDHTATRLANGKVLVVGGSNGVLDLATAELFDPATGTWSPAGSLNARRSLHTATLLPSGAVLVVGGTGASGALQSAELYDPATNNWSLTAPMSTPRLNHAAASLQSGKVLVVGGFNPNQRVGVATAETYDPTMNAWSPAGTLLDQRQGATATTLLNGQVLVASGFSDSTFMEIFSAEIYDPAANSWSATAPLANARQLHVATLLASGKVLITGGFTHNQTRSALSSAELYDPLKGTWSSAGDMTVKRGAHAAARLANGRVLVIGGGVFSLGGSIIDSLKSVELYEPPSAVVEFYNSGLDNFFITAELPEQTAIASGSAGPGWTVTGEFNPGGASQVCRFYGSITPGPNSHFYTIDPAECQALKDIQASTPATQKRWNFESLDFASTIPSAGQCPAGTVPVYRTYNDGFARGVDSNHRITASPAAYQAQIARGWKDEGVVMCAPE
ncbi:MAG: kelch repeat-containing protein [Betaproteobacteria bacterium]